MRADPRQLGKSVAVYPFLFTADPFQPPSVPPCLLQPLQPQDFARSSQIGNNEDIILPSGGKVNIFKF